MSGRPRVVVVGGGITGLAAAYHLVHGTTAAPGQGADVVLLEAAERPGGEIRTVEVAGRRVDVGADAYLARQPHADRLARRLGLGTDLVAPASGQVHLLVDGRLRPLPTGTVFGVPGDVSALARAGVLGPAGLARAVAGLLAPAAPAPPDGDASVADTIGRRVGHEVVERLVEPLLGGVYAGRADRLSLAATMPQVATALRAGGPLLARLRASQRTAAAASGPVFRTVAGGMERLVGALAAALPDGVVRLGTPATALARDGDGWVVETPEGAEPADAVVLAVQADVAARALAGVAPTVAGELAAIRYASVATVTLALPAPAARAVPPGSGLLVPRREGLLVKAVTWSSAKWPHLTPSAEDEPFLIRCSVGRVDDDRALALDDEDLADRVEDELAAIGIQRRALERRVTRWRHALPQYEVGHRARLERIRTGLRRHAPGVVVAGAAYDGVGISHCVRQAEEAAAAILTTVPSPR